MVSTELKGVGLHYTAFRDAIREDSRQTTPSRGVTPRKSSPSRRTWKVGLEAFVSVPTFDVSEKAVTEFPVSGIAHVSPIMIQ